MVNHQHIDPTMYPFESHYVVVGPGRMHYIDVGAGEPLVFVHGTPTWGCRHELTGS